VTSDNKNGEKKEASQDVKPLSGVGVISWREASRGIAVVLQLPLCHNLNCKFLVRNKYLILFSEGFYYGYF